MKPIAGAYYYLWYTKEQWNKWGYVHTPLLGFYESSDQKAIEQHLDWATEYGIDFFFIAWQGPKSVADDNLGKVFLPTLRSRSAGRRIKFAIFYEPWYNPDLKKTKDKTGRETIDIADPDNLRIVCQELRWASKYFSEEDYLKMVGKPVVGLYKARDFSGDVYAAIGQLRKALPTAPYLIGDRIWWREGRQSIWFNFRDAVHPYNGASAYNMHHNRKLGEFERLLDSEYDAWSKALSKTEFDFIPGAIPGYDDRNVPERKNKPLPRSTTRFEQQIEIARRRFSERNPMVLVNSFNEWHEDTQIEPDKYEYGTRYLEIVRNRLSGA